MATDGSDPKPCDRDIFLNGVPVALLDGPSNAVENWVKKIVETAKARIDWHYSGGIAQVLFLGDRESRARVHAAIDQQGSTKKVRVMKKCVPGEQGLNRANVTNVPEGAILASMDPATGEAEFVVKAKPEPKIILAK